ncbi:MlaD family protein [Campylobacter pinnipediorum]|uniref:MlaD family protein n=1 Tax=Campylobacter pinnipediorum TaxID=1965231 RepID=UPI00084DC963|nr:MlaD family protein [Campylobacter pinnipediorum]AQW81697.1 lipid asymmetry ABC transporter MlaABCDEF, periplasmic component MlaD [Campylobacter pinnipediorum subsp. pinnipediorum]AQW83373.1 lipid asymmetry ABC transporter MlaABCDEF, periplasmic component MlaD [Campylobacter pinnipediorum subsp. pinnipediorum]
MENRNSYTIVGLFFTLCIILFAVFMWWMSDSDKNISYEEYYIVADELPSGIRVESQVKFVGVVVGSVSKIEFEKSVPERIRLTLKIRSDVPIKKDSLADVEYQIVSGISTLNISRGSEEFDTNYKIINLKEGIFSQLTNKAQNISDRINDMFVNVDKLISDENLKHLQTTLVNIDILTKSLSDEANLKNINEILKNLNGISANIKDTKINELVINLNNLVNNANNMVVKFNGLIGGFDGVQEKLNSKLSSGEYDFKQTLQPTLDQTKEFLTNFEKTLRQIRNTLNRLEDNPYEFFFKDVKER